ncbi:estradiol 17-beta-dehydrogenase 2 [Culex quinquefasciatus]|uniref:Estradiol 17-beta-dehydrogenase 2 n=1 Tax=Culex quinquefasciatus TaxID=7176 RepID=B0WWJ3_CULQU|nr:estradiol 17-beta-dehydrogenase 2 [Culex quinquefasciatus]|eukprot:XP_001861765.1 estradiol 17-beta-dehydrogenase 2 [Culex quinquefasciatus]
MSSVVPAVSSVPSLSSISSSSGNFPEVAAANSGLLTESLFLVGTGAFGMMSVLQRGSGADLVKYAGLMTVSTATLLLLLGSRERRKLRFTERSIVVVTGCDSGLGFNIAKLCHGLGFVVFAGCLNKESEGAQLLLELDGKSGRVVIVPLDITHEEKIMVAHKLVKDFLEQKPEYELFALVNNAGVMCFGEFEWQLNDHIDQQIDINLIGTMKMTKAHCSLQALPGLSVYSASKAALRFWTEALRQEMSCYGVQVVNFIPGSLVMQSNICANQQRYAEQMKAAFTSEQSEFYGSYFDEYNAYLRVISGTKPVQQLPDNHDVLRTFEDALLDATPCPMYKCEPWRYRFYHFLFRIAPTAWSDWLVRRFIAMPQYRTPDQRKVSGIGASL